jgi:predicted small lipoprotein YifL
MSRIILALAALTMLAACGVKGDLDRPDPLWNAEDAIRRECQRQLENNERAGRALRAIPNRRSDDAVNHFEYRDGVLCCEGVSLADIAEAVGTPVYVYSSATLERHYEVFKQAFAPRDTLVAFAVKANANIAVINTLARKGAGADTVSQGEIERALIAGVPPERIIFPALAKPKTNWRTR